MTDYRSLPTDIYNLIGHYETLLYISSESVKELIVAFRHKGLWHKKWTQESDIIKTITQDFQIDILPVGKIEMQTYAKLEINTYQDHRDPSDHVIIAHAITNKLPLISCDRKFKFYTRQGLDLISY